MTERERKGKRKRERERDRQTERETHAPTHTRARPHPHARARAHAPTPTQCAAQTQGTQASDHKGGVEQAVLRPRRGALRVGVDGEHVGALPEMCAVHGEFAELL